MMRAFVLTAHHSVIAPLLVTALCALPLVGCAGNPFMSGFSDPAELVSDAQPEPTPDELANESPDHPVGSGGASNLPLPPNNGGAAANPSVEPSAGAPTASGGETGSGGAANEAPALELIDDLEGAFPHLPERAGRSGGWYAIHDDSPGQSSPASAVVASPPAADSGSYAVSVSGAGFTDWGAQLGVSLTSAASGYDASAYCGVRFLAKGKGANWSLLLSDRPSVPQGGVCVLGSWDAPCYRFVGKTFEVGSEWREYELSFAELLPLDASSGARKLDAAGIYDILFNFYSPEGSAFELMVDDLSFITKTHGSCPPAP